MADSSSWPPQVADYVHVIATGELGLVIDIHGGDDDSHFVVAIYPRDSRDRVLGTLMEQRLFRLDDLTQ